MVMPTGKGRGGIRTIAFARISAGLRAALMPVLDDRDDLSAMAGVPPVILARVLDGVPRPMHSFEQAAVRRLASLVCWSWNDGILVEVRTAETPRLVKTRGDREACSGGNLTPGAANWDR